MCHQAVKRSRVLEQTGFLSGVAHVGCAILVLWVSGASVYGSYMLTPLSGGQDAVTVDRGSPFVLDLVLTSDTADEIDIVEIAVVFSEPGLRLDSVTWHGQFAGAFVGSTPFNLPAIIVDDSADIDEAIPGILNSSFGYQGQKCSACSRVIVLDSIYGLFVQRLIEGAKSLKIGEANLPGTDVAAVINKSAYNKIINYIKKAKKQGGKVLLDGETIDSDGYYISPTIVEVTNQNIIAKEEFTNNPVINPKIIAKDDTKDNFKNFNDLYLPW